MVGGAGQRVRRRSLHQHGRRVRRVWCVGEGGAPLPLQILQMLCGWGGDP